MIPIKAKYFVLDVDGVLTRSMLLYTAEGKLMKVFGPDDHDALNILRDKLKIKFITGDKRGFEISKRRIVDEMGFELYLVSTYERAKWFIENTEPENTIYMADGIFDGAVFNSIGYSICPSDGFYQTRMKANFVTNCEGGNRAVAEACVHILEVFFQVNELQPNTKIGIWKQ